MTTPIQQATEALQQGKRQEALDIVSAAVKAAQEKAPNSPEYAASEFDLARVLVTIGELPRAAQALKRAVDVPATEDAHKQARLAYLTNLGEVLARMGQLDDAQKVHEMGLAEREKVFGKGTPGHAVGEAPLAEVLLAKGQFDEAERLAETALAALWKAGNPQAIPVVALRAVVRGAKYGDERPLLEPFNSLPAQLQQELIRIALMRAQGDRPEATLVVLTELRERMEDAKAHLDLLPRVIAAISNAATAAEAHEERQEALEWLLEHFDETKDEKQALEAALGIALAKDAADDPEGAEAQYKLCLERATPLGPAAIARVHRNRGIFLSQRDRKDEALVALKDALAAAEASDDKEIQGNATLALGVHLQRDNKPEEAQPLIERSLSLLPPTHPDTLYAKAYLNAIVQKRPFDGNNPKSTLAHMIEALIRPHLPEDLLNAVEIKSLANFSLNLALARQPTQDEQNLLSRLLGQAVGLLRNNVRIQRRKKGAGEPDDEDDDDSEEAPQAAPPQAAPPSAEVKKAGTGLPEDGDDSIS